MITLFKQEHVDMLNGEILRAHAKHDQHRNGSECPDPDCVLIVIRALYGPDAAEEMLAEAAQENGLHIMTTDNVMMSEVNGNTVSSDDEAKFVGKYANSALAATIDEALECACIVVDCDHYKRMVTACDLATAARQARVKWEHAQHFDGSLN